MMQRACLPACHVGIRLIAVVQASVCQTTPLLSLGSPNQSNAGDQKQRNSPSSVTQASTNKAGSSNECTHRLAALGLLHLPHVFQKASNQGGSIKLLAHGLLLEAE